MIVMISTIVADPAGEQLRALQRLLIRLVRGETNVVNSAHASLTKHDYVAPTAEEWSSSLPFRYDETEGACAVVQKSSRECE